MKKHLLYIGCTLLIMFGCKEDANLNEIIPYRFAPTSVEVASQSVTLKAEILTEHPIQEKGFILERTYQSNFNYDNYSLDTIVIAADAPFEYTVTSDMDKNQPCTAYAYIKQNGHYYRNEEVTFIPNGCNPPIINSVTFSYDNKWGNYFIIKGENFSKIKKRNIIRCYKDEVDIYLQFDVLHASSNEIICSYRTEQTGNVKIEVYVGNLKTSFSCTLPGPIVTSWTPQNPRYGEIITLNILGFNKNMGVSFISGSTHTINDINSTIIVEDGYISFPFLSNHKNSSYSIITQEPTYWINTETIHPSIPWMKKQEMGTPLNSYCLVGDKLYIDDWRNQDFGQYQLRCYDFQTGNWSYFPYNDINVYSGLHCYMWNKDTYIYVLHIHERNEWNPVKVKSLMKFNTLTHEWETMADAPFETLVTGIYHLDNNVYVYLTDECYRYSIQEDKWEKLDGKIEPAIAHIAGEYEGNIYYIAQSGTGEIIKLKTGQTGKGEFALAFSKDWTKGISSAQIIGQNFYYATQRTGIIKYNFINQTTKHLGIPTTEDNYYRQDYYFFEKERNLYIIHGEDSCLYQYVEDRNG